MNRIELGLDTFGDVTAGADGKLLPQSQVIRNVVAQGILADQVGVDVFGVGEHHRPDYAVSAPEMVLAAIASKTERIRLTSAVTVLSSDDPIRVYQRFATLDAISNGRAEVSLGRGSFTESFPLFGFDLADYDRLFEEKLELFAAVRSEQAVTWSGSTRKPLENQEVYPKTGRADGLPVWIAVGGTPESVVRTARHGFHLTLAVIGGEPARFAPYVRLFHDALEKYGFDRRRVAIHSPGHIARTDEEAKEQFWPHYRQLIDKLGRERGWPPTSRAKFDGETAHGALYVGSPETVARRIAGTLRTLGADRFDLKYGSGPLPHELMMSSVELYGTVVKPRVLELLA
ncbi:MAG TPA: LLM class flavin-dependent oxidoreductase [Thermoanaerobaculia bacterium]|nr:LLM class flavin-dependent oxidoreductase [Thermoanaerobaculia bacterium]